MPWFAARPTATRRGATHKPPDRQPPAQGVDQTACEEEVGLGEPCKQVSVAGEMGLLRRDGELLRLLKPELYPVDVLVEGEGKIAGILSGPEREKVDRLLELAGK